MTQQQQEPSDQQPDPAALTPEEINTIANLAAQLAKARQVLGAEHQAELAARDATIAAQHEAIGALSGREHDLRERLAAQDRLLRQAVEALEAWEDAKVADRYGKQGAASEKGSKVRAAIERHLEAQESAEWPDKSSRSREVTPDIAADSQGPARATRPCPDCVDGGYDKEGHEGLANGWIVVDPCRTCHGSRVVEAPDGN